MRDSKPAAGARGLTEAEKRFRDAKWVLEDVARRIDGHAVITPVARRAYQRAFRRALEAAAAVRAERLSTAEMHEDAA